MRITRTIVAVLTSSAMLGAAGCANYSRGIAKDDKPAPEFAYVYGRFAVTAPKTVLGFDSHPSMGFIIKCANDKTYTLRFSTDAPLQVVKVTPSECAFTGTVFTNSDGQVRSTKMLPERFVRSETYAAGKAYYLGDFKGAVWFTNNFRVTTWNWSIGNMDDHFESTTRDMKAAFPNMTDVAAENRVIFGSVSRASGGQ